MGKSSKQSLKNSANTGINPTTKVKRTRKSVPRDSPPRRSSIYRGVTRCIDGPDVMRLICGIRTAGMNHRTRKEDKGPMMTKKRLGHAYDLAALKYWGQDTLLNFPVSTYEEELKEMEGQSKEEYIGSLRSGFSRGVSKYRGVARHHHNGRWEARIGRVFGNKYLYLGTYATQEEAATAYDMAAIEYRGLNAVTNFDLSRYVKWLRPDNQDSITNPQPNPNGDANPIQNLDQKLGLDFISHQQGSNADDTDVADPARPCGAGGGSGVIGIRASVAVLQVQGNAGENIGF
ncbi:hypothetical protein OIU78_013284 [Salix suchowensis]|nr:hypothetical protein OIU78_013284 [Salix suchowensis]